MQEVVANAEAIKQTYPQARCAIELGGQDAKALFFHPDPRTGEAVVTDMRMNGSCAGGTGAFLDEMANLMNIGKEGFEPYACKGTRVYDISGRCGVFAKTDIQPLLIQGAALEDLCLSTFHAVAKQTIGGLAQGLKLEAPIVFEGGPLTYNPTLIRVFSERLNLNKDDVLIPDHPETMVAKGAALSCERMYSKQGNKASLTLKEIIVALKNLSETSLNEAQHSQPPLFDSPEQHQAFDQRHDRECGTYTTPKRLSNTSELTQLSVSIGIDSGSTTSKIVLLNDEGAVIDSYYAHNMGDPLKVVSEGLNQLQQCWQEKGFDLNVQALGTTGYGEKLMAAAFHADLHTVETVAHARGCTEYVPDATFILDIGGQDMKAIWLNDGVIQNIVLNEACSSGCGSFLEGFASTLGVAVDEIAEAAFASKNPAKLGSRCTVFMTSTVVNAQRDGKNSNDILAGLARSIIENVFTKVIRVSNTDELGSSIVVQGGTFRNRAVLRALEEYLGKDVTLAPYPGEMGALGVALLAQEKMQNSCNSSFIGFEEATHLNASTDAHVTCEKCANHCALTVVTFNDGSSWTTGNRCEKGAPENNLQDETKHVRGIDVFAKRERLLEKNYLTEALCEPRNIVIGLPCVLGFWESLPYWKAFFSALGFTPVVSDQSNQALYENGLRYIASDTVCMPAKLVHGHIVNLAEKKVDRIFMPHVMHVPPEGIDDKSPYMCSILMGYSTVINNFESPEKEFNISYDAPVFHWYSEDDRMKQVSTWASETLGVDKEMAQHAHKLALHAQECFNIALQKATRDAIENARARGSYTVVLAGRPYHSDPFLSHGVSRMLASSGINVVPVDGLEGIKDIDLSNARVEITNNFHTRMLAGAYLAAEHDDLEYVQIVSFGCGHDAVLTDEIIRISKEVGNKHPLILKLDESEATGSISIRVTSFIETISAKRTKQHKENHVTHNLPDPFPVKYRKQDKELRTLLVPNIFEEVSIVLDALLQRDGFHVQRVPVGGIEEINLGKRYTHNDICFPCQMVIGEVIRALGERKSTDGPVAVGMVKFQCDCRMSHYAALLRKALDDAGYADVPILTTDAGDSKNMHPGVSLLGAKSVLKAVWTFTMLDIIADITRKTRPYELNKGQTDETYQRAVHAIAQGAKKSLRQAIHQYSRALDELAAIPYDRTHVKPRVLVTGELLVTYHPGSNFHIEQYLENNGMEALFPRVTSQLRKDFLAAESQVKDFDAALGHDSIYVGKLFNAAQSTMERIARKHPLFEPEPSPNELYSEVADIIPKTLSCGEGWLMSAEIVHYAKQGVNSFVILQPFGCLPNHVCGRGMTKRIKEDYPTIQILPLDLDPDTSFANVENRLQMLMMNSAPEGLV